MNLPARILSNPFLVSGLIAALAFANWLTRPEEVWRWALAAFMFPAAQVMIAVMKRRACAQGQNADERKFLIFSLYGAGWIVVGALSLSLAEDQGLISGEMPDRIFGVLTGAFFIAMGDATPKILPTLAHLKCNPATIQSLHRFIGRVFVLMGLVTAGIWIFAPITWANEAAMAACLTAVALGGSRLLWLVITGRLKPAASDSGKH